LSTKSLVVQISKEEVLGLKSSSQVANLDMGKTPHHNVNSVYGN